MPNYPHNTIDVVSVDGGDIDIHGNAPQIVDVYSEPCEVTVGMVEPCDIKVDAIPPQSIEVTTDVIIKTEGGGGEPYHGTYVVTPSWDTQTLPTRNKTLSDNVTVKSVPVYKIKNATGGYTISVVKEIK